MKTKKTLYLLALLVVWISGCKNPDLDIDNFKIENEKVTPTTAEVTIKGSYSYTGNVIGIGVNLSKTSTMTNEVSTYETQLSGTDFSVTITHLEPGTTYYYCYSIDYGSTNPYLTATRSFSTTSQIPEIKTIEILPIDSTTIAVKCEVIAEGGAEVVERGICWNTYGEPNMDDETLTNETGGLGEYMCQIGDLTAATRYYVRAFAKNEAGFGFGEVLEFVTDSSIMLPTVTTLDISEITPTSATCHGLLVSDGGSTMTECGVCWSTQSNPTTNDNHLAAQSTGLGEFVVVMENLMPNQTYFARTYAINTKGTGYGQPLSFTTTEGLPSVTTGEVSDITTTSATFNGIVNNIGASNVTERGFYYSTNPDPNANSNHITCGTGQGNFSTNISNLTRGTTYYVRAYAINEQGFSTGNMKEFKTLTEKPTVETTSVSDVTMNSAKCSGNVIDDGGEPVIERGICWSTAHNPTIDNNHHASGTGTGPFQVFLIDLNIATQYFIKAYAINSNGVSYGEEMTFITDITLPTVLTYPVTEIEMTRAVGNGEVTDDGGASIQERGICWSEQNTHPTIDDNHISVSGEIGSFSAMMTDLSPNKTYYVRAYAINSKGVSYGNPESFTTESTTWVNGLLPGQFSVSNTQRVCFSQGNLQYQASTNTWRFAENQYEYIGEENRNVSPTYSGWIDLFGWGTSGYNHGAVCYQPWSTSNNYTDYYAYGSFNYNLYDQTGKADWGCNAISNGGNHENDGWRSLTLTECIYLFLYRQTTSGYLYAKANVNGINGLLVLPDNWSSSTYSLANANSATANFSTNVISLNDWLDILEPAGVVFLPAAGDRSGSEVYEYEDYGLYWTSSKFNQERVGNLLFGNTQIAYDGVNLRFGGFSVRLVKNVNN